MECSELLNDEVVKQLALHRYRYSLQEGSFEFSLTRCIHRRRLQQRTAPGSPRVNHVSLLIDRNINYYIALCASGAGNLWIGRLRQTNRLPIERAGGN